MLSPVGVLPAWQKRGVGSALIRRGLEILAERAVPVVFLEGSPRYYSRFGFEPGAGQGFRKPSLRIPDAAFQALRLPSYEPWMTGTLVYSEIFWRHDAVGLRDADDEPLDGLTLSLNVAQEPREEGSSSPARRGAASWGP